MIFRFKFWRPEDPTAIRLARQLFDQPIIQNRFRSAYVKEMVSPNLQKHGWRYTGAGRVSWDFEHSDGCRLRVQQAAARQTRSETHVPEAHPVFDIRPRYDVDGGSTGSRGPADLYLIAWHPISSLQEADHRNVQQWQFYLLPARAIPQTQKTMGLARLRDLTAQRGGGPVSFSAVAGAVEGWRLRLRAEAAVGANERIPVK